MCSSYDRARCRDVKKVRVAGRREGKIVLRGGVLPENDVLCNTAAHYVDSNIFTFVFTASIIASMYTCLIKRS